ncbi:MAG: peptidoglycan DD-metalloendopeptidase family protein [Bacteroidota bacterium]
MLPILAKAQDRTDLESKRLQLLQEIEATSNQLDQTRKNKAATLDRYFALQRQIKKRQELIVTLRQELSFADTSIYRTQDIIAALQRDLDNLKTEYSEMLRLAYRHQRNNSMLLFLFAADNFNDFLRRWQYIRQYGKFRNKQADLILETNETLEKKVAQLEAKKLEKQELLAKQEQQKQLLDKELNDKNSLLSTLKTSESKLVAELDEQQKAHQRLNSAIEKIIQKEMALKREIARTPEVLETAPTPSTPIVNNSAFQQNKGSLPWPVKSGEISRYFGKQPHPTIPTIQITNNGIDIRTSKQAKVYAVHSGKVVGTQFIPGYQNMIIIQHGTYYTVYSNLEKIFVKRGDQVDRQHLLGRVSTAKPEVHFEVWREKQRLNPTKWVAKR